MTSVAKWEQANIVHVQQAAEEDYASHSSPQPFDGYGRKRRSMPELLRMRLAISSIEHSVVSITGME